MCRVLRSIQRKPWFGRHWIRDERRIALHLRDDWSCQYCGKRLKDAAPGQVTLDHLIPRVWFEERGLPIDNGNHNLVTACKPCNDSKQNTGWLEFASPESIQRIAHTITLPVNIALGKAILAGQLGEEVA
jgi:5-methylcytosine-specific restriction endonuclease McrA